MKCLLHIYLYALAFCFISVPLILKAQILPPTEDVVYLKNGSIIRGKIIQLDKKSHVRIEILGGSELVYPYSEVKDIKLELAKYKKIKVVYPRQHAPITLRQKGYYHIIGWGTGFGQNNWENTVSLNLQYSLGYYFNQYLQVGGSVGIDAYGSAGFMPFEVEIRGDLTKKTIMPHYFLQAGYGHPFIKSWEIQDLKGGATLHAGVGIKINTRRKTEWLFTLGFKAQQSYQERNEGWDPWAQRTIVSTGVRRYQRIVFMTSLGF